MLVEIVSIGRRVDKDHLAQNGKIIYEIIYTLPNGKRAGFYHQEDKNEVPYLIPGGVIEVNKKRKTVRISQELINLRNELREQRDLHYPGLAYT